MVTKMHASLALLAVLLVGTAQGFLPTSSSSVRRVAFAPVVTIAPRVVLRSSADTSSDDDDEDDDSDSAQQNPFADPNYPDLEFINYSDPEYQVDQGTDEYYNNKDSTEEEIEVMREDRRRRNDEYQFQTYFAETLKGGDEYKGEWTVYKTSTFLPNFELQDDGIPRLVKAGRTLKVISSAYKTKVETDSPHKTDAERIRHEECAVSGADDQDDDDASLSPEAVQTEKEILSNTYWPEQLAATDFRGQQGTMCVGSAYTISNAVTMSGESVKDANYQGPFKQYSAELGLHSKHLRMRLKFDYSVLEEEISQQATPPLHLKSMTVCRETRDMWPRSDEQNSVADEAVPDVLFGDSGAPGGLYDPPPVGSEEQAGQYMLLDLAGQATVLFPFKLDQAPDSFEGHGWVTSLDWTPGNLRYQVDRKIKGGAELMCLRTLELTEVQGSDADRYRPRDGGENMRQ